MVTMDLIGPMSATSTGHVMNKAPFYMLKNINHPTKTHAWGTLCAVGSHRNLRVLQGAIFKARRPPSTIDRRRRSSLPTVAMFVSRTRVRAHAYVSVCVRLDRARALAELE